MGFNCGIIGLPNVGKSTLFNAITSKGVKASNFPFCTIDPNVGVVAVPDKRLYILAALVSTNKIVPTTLEFVDIAGLVKGASSGEGLGNRFLSHIRQVDAIAHVVRCFDDDNVIHVHNKVSPKDDIEIVHTELIMADLETIQKRMSNKKALEKHEKKDEVKKVYEKISAALSKGIKVDQLGLTNHENRCIKDLHLLTAKPMLYIANIADIADETSNCYVDEVREIASKEGTPVVTICTKIEAEIAELEEDDKRSFLCDYGLTESGLDKVVSAGYDMLKLLTFFTAGPKETRAWTIKRGSLAPQAAGVIHTDFERGFIKAEVISYEDYISAGSETAAREKGVMRFEGKEYIVKDGDVMHFRFNV